MCHRFAEQASLEGCSACCCSRVRKVGGFKEVIAIIEGQRVYSQLKWESGVHRVQRVPATETQGRVHTSAVTVAVLPEAEEVDIKIEAKDLRIDTFCSSGPAPVRQHHLLRCPHHPPAPPTRSSAPGQKSQIKNREKVCVLCLRSMSRRWNGKMQSWPRNASSKSAPAIAARRSNLQLPTEPPHRSPHRPHSAPT